MMKEKKTVEQLALMILDREKSKVPLMGGKENGRICKKTGTHVLCVC